MNFTYEGFDKRGAESYAILALDHREFHKVRGVAREVDFGQVDGGTLPFSGGVPWHTGCV